MEFSLKRFGRVLYKDYISYRKWFILIVLIMFIAVFCITIIGHKLIATNGGGASQMLLVTFFAGLILLGGYFSSTNLGDLRTPQRRLHYLSLPASTFEKVLSKWLYTLPLFVLVLASVYFIFFTGYESMYGHMFNEEAKSINYKIKTRMFPYFIGLYVFGHSVALFFSFLYNRYTAIKGILVCAIIFFSIAVFKILLDNSVMLEKGILEGLMDSVWNLMAFTGDKPLQLVLLAPIFWVLTYFVAKRKQL